MQRYRINHRLIIGLFVGFIVVGVSAHFFHAWRISRRADDYQKEAAQKFEEKEYLEALKLQRNFVMFRPDDDAARIELAKIALDVCRLPKVPRKEAQFAWGTILDVVRRTSDKSLRRELAKMILTHQAPKRAGDALGHLEELLQNDPSDPELNRLKVEALFRIKDYRRTNEFASKLVGFDVKSETFSDEKTIGGDQPEIFYMLAQSLMRAKGEKETSLLVIDRMIEMNPDSHLAHLNLSTFLSALGEKEKAAASLDRAYELDPTDVTILVQKGRMALGDENFEEAAKIFRDAVELHPDNLSLYRSLARVEMARKNYDEALAVVEEGLLEFRDQQGVYLKLEKVEIQLNIDDFAGVEQTLKELTDQNIPALIPLVDFSRARILLKQGHFARAAKALERVRPKLINERNLQVQAGSMLAACYEQLGKPDLALQTYELILNEYPKYTHAVQGRNRVRKKLGLGNPQQNSEINGLVRANLALPEDEQDWEPVNRLIDENIEKRELSEIDATLLRLQLLLQRKKIPEAEELLRVATSIEPENVAVRYAASALAAIDPEKGPAVALDILDTIVAEQGSSFLTRVRRAALLLSLDLDDDSLVEQLSAMGDGIDDWSLSEKLRMNEVLAIQFQQLGKLKESRQFWNKVSELSPNNLPVLMKLFTIALREQDDLAMSQSQAAILDIVKDKNDANYILTQAKRQLAGFAQKSVSREELSKTRKLLDTALMNRPQWHELHIVYGQLLLTLQEDLGIALEYFENALEYGPPSPGALVWHVKLLAQFGETASALEKMELLPKAIRERVLGDLEAELLSSAGEKERAYAAAKKVASMQPGNPAIQVWFANFAKEADESEAAIEALHRAIKIDPSSAAYWTQLADVYLKAKDMESLQETLRDAQLAVDAEFLPLLTAKLYEYRGQFQNAEDVYLSLYADRLGEVGVDRRLAEFYLLWGRLDATKTANAFSYINRILREAYEGRAAMSDPQVVWARDRAARHLGSTRDYRQSVKAQLLLLSGEEDGKLTVAHRVLLGEILTSMRDPKSQLKAIRIFEDLNQQGQLQKKHILLLAQLLNRTGDSKGCESLLTDALPTYRNDPELWSAYINFLIDRGEYGKASSRLNRYEELKPDKMAYINLRARLASEKGDKDQLRSLLKSLTPPSKGGLDAKQLQQVYGIAQLAARYKDFELAEQLLRFYAKRIPASIGALANFLALHGDSDEAVELMKQLFDRDKDAVLQLSTRMLRSRRSEIGDRFDETFEKMFSSAIREDPDSVARLTMHAEFLELQLDFEGSIQAYDKLLKRGDLSSKARATASNNLGFLLALKGEQLEHADELVNEAMEILGPIDDMLDTRAVVRIARQEYDLAVEDLTLATSISQDPIKYYHLAKAHLLAGNDKAAQKAWSVALKREFKKDLLSLLEQKSFEDIEQRLESLRP